MTKTTAPWIAALALLLAGCPAGPGPDREADGGEVEAEEPVTDYVLEAAWSPDSRRIVAAWDRGARARLFGLLAPGPEGAPPEAARGLPVTEGQAASPSWHPDRLWVAFETDRDGQGEIYRVRPDGTGPENLTSHPADDREPAYSPDGGTIAFTSDRDGDSRRVYLMRADGSDPRPLGATLPDGDHHGPAWSPDGRRIVFWVSGGAEGEIFVAAADGSGWGRVGAGESPSFSSDGQRILFAQHDSVFWRPAAGGLRRLLVADGFAPRESPDGRWVLFVRGNRPASSLYLLDLESLAETRITP